MSLTLKQYPMDPLRKLIEKTSEIEKKIEYFFQDKDLLISSLVHRSFINEYKGGDLQHNERLEFLGDSVLNLLLAEFLYRKLPDSPEGKLSELRSRLVDENACAQYLRKIDLSSSILLGRGELIGEGREKSSILSDVFEAILAAIYLDGGMGSAKAFLLSHFEEDFLKTIETPQRNFKAELQDFSQKKYHKPPRYEVTKEEGPEHAKVFYVTVFVDETFAGQGKGFSKKEAEAKAALEALNKEGL